MRPGHYLSEPLDGLTWATLQEFGVTDYTSPEARAARAFRNWSEFERFFSDIVARNGWAAGREAIVRLGSIHEDIHRFWPYSSGEAPAAVRDFWPHGHGRAYAIRHTKLFIESLAPAPKDPCLSLFAQFKFEWLEQLHHLCPQGIDAETLSYARELHDIGMSPDYMMSVEVTKTVAALGELPTLFKAGYTANEAYLRLHRGFPTETLQRLSESGVPAEYTRASNQRSRLDTRDGQTVRIRWADVEKTIIEAYRHGVAAEYLAAF